MEKRYVDGMIRGTMEETPSPETDILITYHPGTGLTIPYKNIQLTLSDIHTLIWIARGLSNKEFREKAGISPQADIKRLNLMKNKMQVTEKQELINLMIDLNVLLSMHIIDVQHKILPKVGCNLTTSADKQEK